MHAAAKRFNRAMYSCFVNCSGGIHLGKKPEERNQGLRERSLQSRFEAFQWLRRTDIKIMRSNEPDKTRMNCFAEKGCLGCLAVQVLEPDIILIVNLFVKWMNFLV